MLQFLTILGYITSIIAGAISIYEFLQHRGFPGKVFAGIAVAILLASLALTILNPQNRFGEVPPPPTPTATASAAVPSNPSPTDTPPTLTPSPSPTLIATSEPQPTVIPSPSPQPAPFETINKNTTLHCNCTDRVMVTITKIVVQPSQNSVYWYLTLHNTSPRDADFLFYQFQLQQGDQINFPTQDEPTFDPTGNGVGGADLLVQPSQSQQIVLTFSFVPFAGVPYTLVSQLNETYGQVMKDPLIDFQPVPISF